MHIHGLAQKDAFAQIAINLNLIENFAGHLNALRIFLVLPHIEFNFIVVLHGQSKVFKAIINFSILYEHLTKEFLGHLKLISTFKDLFSKASSHFLLAEAHTIHHILQYFVLVLLAVNKIARQELLAILDETVACCEPQPLPITLCFLTDEAVESLLGCAHLVKYSINQELHCFEWEYLRDHETGQFFSIFLHSFRFDVWRSYGRI